MKAILVPFGSAGDVHPFVGIGLALRRRGHEVTFLTIPDFAPLLRRHSFDLVEFGDPARFARTLQDERLWHPTKSLDVIAESVVESLQPIFDGITKLFEPGRTVVVSGTLAMGARVAQEVHGLPLVTVHLSPSVFRTVHDTPILGGFQMPRWLPPFAKKGLYRVMDWMVDGKMSAKVNQFRSQYDLAPVSRLMADWWNSPQCILAMFPEWFAPRQADWPSQTVQTGFPLFDESESEGLPADVESFLSEGSPPVLFAPGSAQIQGHDFFRASAKACEMSGMRGIFVTRYPEQIPSELPPGVVSFPYVPFSQILPRCSALVHHGGIGTTAQGLAAALPHLVRPMAHDQQDNASRLQRLGVGQTLMPNRYSPESAAAVLSFLRNDETTQLKARALAAKIASGSPLESTCDAIERVWRSG